MPEEDPKEKPPEEPPKLAAEGLGALDGSTPWRDPNLLPEKPDAYLYGVKFSNHPKLADGVHPCGSQEELVELLKKESRRVGKVFLPEHDRGVPLRSLNLGAALLESRSDPLELDIHGGLAHGEGRKISDPRCN